MTLIARRSPRRWGPLVAAALFALALAGPAASGSAAEDESPAQTEVQAAAADLTTADGLETMVSDYETRVPTEYTTESWEPFAEALTTAADISEDDAATESEVADAKTELQTAASELEVLQSTFETITNNTFWRDTAGNPIYSQGGGVFKFGDTYYWYGVHYRGAESYLANPTQKYDNQVSFRSIPVYSSQDLVNWKFENNVATTSTGLGNLGGTMGNAGWIGRLGVSYNENTGKYVLPVQMWRPSHDHGVLFLQGNSPTGNFTFGNFQRQVTNSPTTGTGDQTVFTDEDGQDYLIFSNREGRSRAFVSKLRASDSLYAEPAVEIGRNGDGREGNAMFKLDGKYHMCASDLHGWNTSVNYCLDSTQGRVQGDYTGYYTMPGTQMDYSHVTQTGFFVTVKGTQQETVLYAGDRWADFAWNGIGYNQWVPITKEGTGIRFHSMSQWQFNATTGEFRVAPGNNYILNPDIQADRIIVSNVVGWTRTGSGGVTNVNGGANGSRFALQVSNGSGVRQQMQVPSGTYTLGLYTKGSGRVTVTGADGQVHTLNVPSSSGWSKRELTGITLPAGTATVTVNGGSGNLTADQFSLVRQGGDDPGPGDATRYEAEGSGATCTGTIDSNHSGYSGTGFCNGDNTDSAYAEFTVQASAAGTATLDLRFANGSSAGRPADLIVNGTRVETASFASTGSWTGWSTQTVTVQLVAGANTIRLDPTTANGLPNIDYLDVAQASG
ncbi:family 43 glycosylhydrolase [Glycomyces buryatensis]|uniref:Carbohydrate-binding protein n=1 Tax=Glycomyces buryatensis TaxID=2570927 RepID=A0A4S8Q810_9ACTN|nr:family 43 glycosylhydrolase [Glycomyces buryatensis]THV36464.1 carbohydrate-binding protein [Glycomyces buryatensis]